MTERDRNDEICGILQDSSEVMRILTIARRDIDAGVWSEAWTRLQHAGRYCEQRQVAEINLLFDRNGNVNEAKRCPNCGFWNTEDWCLIEGCHYDLTDDERAELERDRSNWDSDDLRAGLPSRG